MPHGWLYLVPLKRISHARLFDSSRMRMLPFAIESPCLPCASYMSRDERVRTSGTNSLHFARARRSRMVMVEATAVSPREESLGEMPVFGTTNNRSRSLLSSRKWRVGGRAGIQLAHAGRKGSANRPWEGDDHIPEGQPNSWTTIAPSPDPFGANLHRIPAK